jgi:hypothetical protein
VNSEHDVPRQQPFLETSGHFRLGPVIYAPIVGPKIKISFSGLSEVSFNGIRMNEVLLYEKLLFMKIPLPPQ